MNNYLQETNFQNDNEWMSLETPLYKPSAAPGLSELTESPEENFSAEKNKAKKTMLCPVMTFQLIICLLFMIASFLSSAFVPDIFSKYKSAYDKELNTSMVFDGNFKDTDYSVIFK